MRDQGSTATPTPGTAISTILHPSRTQVIRFAVSLIIAMLLWGWVTELNDPFVTVNYREIDVQIGPLDDSLTVVTTLPRATVTLRGPQSEINSIRRNEIAVTLDTSEVTQPGEYRLDLIVSTPDGPTDRTVDPGELPVTIERQASEVVPLEVEYNVAEDDPREVTGVTQDVSQVTVSGTSSTIGRVDRVILPVTIENQNRSFQASFTPYAVDATGQRVSEVTILPQQVTTTVDIQTRGKRISVIPVVSGIPAEGYSQQQRSVLPDSIVVDGPEEALATLLFVNTETVDISGASESLSRRVGLVDLPSGVTVIDPADGLVEVRVAIEDTSSNAQTLTGLSVQPINLPSGMSATIEPTTIDVTVDGPSAILTQMTPVDVKIRVDLANLGPGTYELRPEITVPQGVTWVSNAPQVVQVTITSDASPQSTPVAILESP